jgi:hypothetical protein
MWNQLSKLINFDTFCRGCKCYYEILSAMGLAPTSPVENGHLLRDQPGSQYADQAIFSISMTDIYQLKAARYIAAKAAPVISTHNITHWN